MEDIITKLLFGVDVSISFVHTEPLAIISRDNVIKHPSIFTLVGVLGLHPANKVS